MDVNTKKTEMRVIDIYLREGNKLSENWVLLISYIFGKRRVLIYYKNNYVTFNIKSLSCSKLGNCFLKLLTKLVSIVVEIIPL